MIINMFNNYQDKNFMNGLSELYISIKGFEIAPKSIKDINI